MRLESLVSQSFGYPTLDSWRSYIGVRVMLHGLIVRQLCRLSRVLSCFSKSNVSSRQLRLTGSQCSACCEAPSSRGEVQVQGVRVRSSQGRCSRCCWRRWRRRRRNPWYGGGPRHDGEGRMRHRDEVQETQGPTVLGWSSHLFMIVFGDCRASKSSILLRFAQALIPTT